MVQSGRQAGHRLQYIIQRMRTAYWITKATSTRSEYAILIAFARQHGYTNAPHFYVSNYRGADKSLARPGRKQATATEDFGVHISYL